MKTDTMITAITCRKMMRAKIDLKRIPLLALGNKIADTADGMNLDLGAVLRELLAKAMDVDFDGIGGDLAGQPEDVIFRQLFRDHAILAPHQQLEHGGLAGRQNLRLVVDIRLPALGVECEIGDLKRASKQLARPPQQRFQPSDQLLERERLDEVVVSTAAQPADAILHASPRGQHQHRYRVPAMANLAQDRQPIAIGQTKIEN